MQVPILSKRRTVRRESIENRAMVKAIEALGKSMDETGLVEKGFLTGNAATLMSAKGGASSAKHPGTSWSNQGGASSQLIARVTQNLSEGFGKTPEELELALAEQGLSWGPPFPPGRPLDPFYGYRRPARTFDYSVGTNTQLTPRWNRVSFPTIKSVYEAYDVAQICVRHLINDVRSLDFNWEPIPGIKDDVSDEIERAIEFFDSPDKRQPFRTWLAEWLQDVLRYDAGSLYIRRNQAYEPIALEVVSGETIIPLVDFYGRRPEDEDDEAEDPEGMFGGDLTPAYVQIIEGLPWDWLTSDDLIYQPWNPLPESQYGLAPLEAVLLSANTDIRFQWHFLQFFTEGTLPAGFMEAPPDMSDPSQIASWQETWDAVMQGDQTKLRQIRWVPNGSKFTAAKPDANNFDSEFPLYLMRRTCASFGVTPNDLGFTENVNRATGDTQVDVQFRVGTSPLLRYVEDVINLFTKQHLKLRCRIRFDDGKETEDRVATATADGIYLDHGVIGVDEVRADLGKPIDKSKPSPRYINNSRVGPIPLLSLESMAGEIDPDTYGVADSQELVDTPYIPPPGVIPAAGTEELKGSDEASARAANALRGSTPDAGPTAVEGEDDAATAGGEDGVEKAWKALDGFLSELEGEIEGGTAKDLTSSAAPDNTGGPGVRPATTVNGGTDGISVATGVQGEDLLDDDDDEDDEDDAIKAAQVALCLRRWRDNSRNRMKKGRAPRRFVDPMLPDDLAKQIWSKLEKARTREEVDAVFQKAGKSAAGDRPAFHSQADAITGHYAPEVAKALGSLFSQSAIKAAVKAAQAARVEKSTAPPNLRESTGSERCDSCWAFGGGKCQMYDGFKVRASQTCDSWAAEASKEAEPDPAARAAMELKGATASTAKLKKVLSELHGDSLLVGSHDAAHAAGGTIAASLKDVSAKADDAYWDDWEPGYGAAAELAADGGMRDLLDEADVSIQGMTDTTIERIGNAIASGLASGESTIAVAKAIGDIVEDPARSLTIVNTEYARAMTVASVQTYEENGVEEEIFEAEADACPECTENAESGPQKVGEEWPNGPAPVHPECRCAQAPKEQISEPATDADEPEPEEG